MDQRSIAGNSSVQVGHDFIQKIFDLSVSNQNFSQFNILNPDDSEIKSYLSYWEKLNSNQRINLVLNCREYIKETYKPKTLKKDKEISLSSNIFFILFILLFLLTQYRGYRYILLKNEYIVSSNIVSTYCKVSKDVLLPLPTCITLNQENKLSQDLEKSFQNDFEKYKSSWMEFIVSCLIIPWIISTFVFSILNYPFTILEKSRQKRRKQKLEQENDFLRRDKRAKEQTYNILFNLLNETEQNYLNDLESSLKLEKIKYQASKMAGIIRKISPYILDNFDIKHIIWFIPLVHPEATEKSKIEIIACIFPDRDYEEILKAVKDCDEMNNTTKFIMQITGIKNIAQIKGENNKK